MAAVSEFEERVLILAPIGRDGPAMAALLVERGFTATVCESAGELRERMNEGAGALLLTEEALEMARLPDLLGNLKEQPSWSELPLIILTHGGESRLARLLDTIAAAAGGITMLERPLGTATLVRAVEVAIRSRRRQYRVRDLIQESANQIASLRENERTIRIQEERLRRVEKLAAAGQMAASLAHEINNPLAAVTNALFYLQNFAGLPTETTDLVDTAAGELARVSRIVKQSLSYYRTGRVAKEIDLSEIVEESLRIFEEKFRKANLQVSTRIHPGVTLLGFGDEIRQAIDNLLLNAIEATPKGGRLAVSLHWSKDRRDQRQPLAARLSIADSGLGIHRDHFSRLFQPFFTTKAEKGNGLGLWVVRGIVDKHDGSIRIRSSTCNRHQGTVVSILWPAPQKSLAHANTIGQMPDPIRGKRDDRNCLGERGAWSPSR